MLSNQSVSVFSRRPPYLKSDRLMRMSAEQAPSHESSVGQSGAIFNPGGGAVEWVVQARTDHITYGFYICKRETCKKE